MNIFEMIKVSSPSNKYSLQLSAKSRINHECAYKLVIALPKAVVA